MYRHIFKLEIRQKNILQDYPSAFFCHSAIIIHTCVIIINVKVWNASRFCVSSLRRGHANLLCIVPILVYVGPKPLQKQSNFDAFIKRISRFTFWKTSYGAWIDSLTLLHFVALGEKSISLFLSNINIAFCLSFSTDHNFSFKTWIEIFWDASWN